MEIPGKRFWITGASSGIGEALARLLAERGASVVLSARRESVLEEVRLSLPRPNEHRIVPLDLTEGDSLEARAARIAAEHGPIHCLINNGGISQRATALDTTMPTLRRLFETNFFGSVALSRGVLPHMIEHGCGKLVIVSSVVGKFGTPKRSGYAASKHALHGYFDALRLELSGQGVDVLMACPGYVKTQISQNALEGDGSAHDALDPGQAAGVPVDTAAERIARGIVRDQKEIYFGGKEVAGVFLKRLAPALLDRLLLKVNVT